MVDKLIAPRRDQLLTRQGFGDRRFMEYLERASSQVNNSTDATELDPSSIDASSANQAALNKQVISLQQEASQDSSAAISSLQKRMSALESMVSFGEKTRYTRLKIDNAVTKIVLLGLYTVATAPDATLNRGGFIQITDEVGGEVPAFSDGINWLRVTDRAIIS